MINIKDKNAISKMETAGVLLAEVMKKVKDLIVPGVNTLEIDAWVDSELLKNNLVSKTKGYFGYKHATCISVNDEVVHGVPSKIKVLSKGDLVKVDVCASWKGYCADMTRCYFVTESSLDSRKLVEITQNALNEGISKALVGNRLSDISAAIQKEIEKNGFGVVRDFAGHGIGKQMHEEPEILNYGKPGHGPILKAGMTFAIEPMVTFGHYDVYVCKDGWTVKTKDKSLAAHLEDTIVITEEEPKILTRPKTGISIA